MDDIEEICSTLSLSCLYLGDIAFKHVMQSFDFQHMLATLAACNMPGLRELGLPLQSAEARHLSKLIPLTALTALNVRMY